jgi:hypothetical protein
MTKPQLIKMLTKYCTVPNQSKTKFFIPGDKINEIAGEIMKLNTNNFVPPSLDEVKEFFRSKGYSEESAIKAWEHYEYGEPAWTDTAGKPVRAWKQKMNTNWLKPENKIVEKNINNPMNGMVL